MADYLTGATASRCRSRGHWALAQSGAALAGPPEPSRKVAEELGQVEEPFPTPNAAERAELQRRESALASELRSLRQPESCQCPNVQPALQTSRCSWLTSSPMPESS